MLAGEILQLRPLGFVQDDYRESQEADVGTLRYNDRYEAHQAGIARGALSFDSGVCLEQHPMPSVSARQS